MPVTLDVRLYVIFPISYEDRSILGPVYDNEKENWRILTNK
jgi:hypothetical protein